MGYDYSISNTISKAKKRSGAAEIYLESIKATFKGTAIKKGGYGYQKGGYGAASPYSYISLE